MDIKIRINRNIKYYLLAVMSLCSSIGAFYGNILIVKLQYLAFLAIYAFVWLSNRRNMIWKLNNIIVLFSFICSLFASRFETFSLLLSYFVIMFSRGLNEKKIVECVFIPRCLLFIINLVLIILKWIPNEVVYRYEYGTLNVKNIRYCLGFSHPNTAYWFYFTLISQYAFIRNKKIKCLELIILTGLSFFMFYLTNSRTGLIVSLLLIIGVIINKYFEKIFLFFSKRKLFTAAEILLFFMGIALPIYFANGGNNAILNKIDFLFTGRFSSAGIGFAFEGVSFFGKIRSFNDTLDSTYIYLLLYSGIITFLIIVCCYIKLIRYLEKKKLCFCGFLTLLYMIYALFEHPFINIFNNFTLFFFLYLR